MTETLREAQLRRMGIPKVATAPAATLDSELDRVFGLVFSEADAVGPEARDKLRAVLKHYAKEAHPYRACVVDNTKHFGPGRTEGVCATLKDIIRGTNQWRDHPDEHHGTPGLTASDISSHSLSDDDKRQLLTALSDEDLQALEAVAVNGS